MTWTAYRVVFRLKSPMHIGCGKVGNVQRTRPYVTGRMFWGALTMRLTRDQHQPATRSELYQKIGGEVHQYLKFTYFYPAIKKTESNQSEENQDNQPNYEIIFPWGNESLFRRRFLSSYASTALVYPRQAADEGLLHEVEFLSPRTLDTGKQVYLVGYVFAKDNCQLNWKEACCKLQMGGERGYGWGDVAPEFPEKQKGFEPVQTNELFCGKATFEATEDGPIIKPTEQLLAHTVTANVVAQGEIEPMVGREWRSHNNATNSYAGQHVEQFGDACWVPGSTVAQSLNFVIGNFGIWHLST